MKNVIDGFKSQKMQMNATGNLNKTGGASNRGNSVAVALNYNKNDELTFNKDKTVNLKKIS